MNFSIQFQKLCTPEYHTIVRLPRRLGGTIEMPFEVEEIDGSFLEALDAAVAARHASKPPPPAPPPTVADSFDDDFLLEALAQTERRAASTSAGPPPPRHDQHRYDHQPVRSDGRGHMPLQPVHPGQATSGHHQQPRQIPQHHHHHHRGPADPNRAPHPVPIDRDNYHRVQAGPPAPPPRQLTVELILEKTGGRVAIECHQGRDEGVAAACRSIPGAAYDGRARRWTVPEGNMTDVARELKSMRNATVKLVMPVPMVQRALAVVVQLERTAAKAEAEADSSNLGGNEWGHENVEGHENMTALERAVERAYARVPASLQTQMFPFQREGVKYGLSRGGRVLIGDQMGLGKTVQALALMSCYEEDWPCLILVPTSLRDAWHEALRRWLNVRPALIASIGSVSVITFVPPLRSLVPYTNTQSPPNY